MATLEALYVQDPFWIWLGLACLFVALNLAAGLAAMAWPALAAIVVALLDVAGLKVGIAGETAIFLVLTAAAFAVPRLRGATPRPAAPARPSTGPERREARVGGGQPAASRLVGRIGRTTSEFVNGVGRVWIDGAEWGAELESGEDLLAEGAPVRVVKVTGGIRLKVQALS